jgi:hypothetical protein
MSAHSNDAHETWKTYTKLNTGREEVDTLVSVERALDESGRDDALLAAQTTEKRIGELGTSVRHGERSAAGAVLGLDDLVTAELDTVDDLLIRFAFDGLAEGALGEQGHDGGAGVATDDGDNGLLGVRVGDLAEEARGTDDVEGGDTKDAAGVEDTGLLKNLSDDGDRRVDGVGDNENMRFGRDAGYGASEVADDGGVRLWNGA